MISNNLQKNLYHVRTSEKAPAIVKDTENHIGDRKNIGNDVHEIGCKICYKIVHDADKTQASETGI